MNGLRGYRNLLWLWTLREIKVRYKQSILGGAWAILQPLLLTLMFTLIFSYFVKLPSDGVPYPIFIYTAMLPWTFLSTSVGFGIPSLVTNLNLITKVFFPREVLPLASIAAALFDFLIASSIFILLLIYYRMPITLEYLWLPAIMLVQIVLTLGVVFIGSALNVFFRDLRFVVPLLLQLWMYASPVVYPISAVPEEILPLYMLNPMAGIIDSYRRILLHGQPPHLPYLGFATLLSLIIGLLGYHYFKREEWKFADLI